MLRQPPELSCALSIDSLPLLRLLQLVSPTLPVGAYSYSRGLEWAVQAGWVHGAGPARDWVAGLLRHALTPVDVPVLGRLMAAWRTGDAAAVQGWSARLVAMRESAEFRAEDRQQGLALARLLADLGLEQARPLSALPEHGSAAGNACCWAALYALAATQWEIPEPLAALGYLWAFTENQVLAAVKLVPLGQTQGQRMLAELAATLPELAAAGLALADDEIGQVAPGLAIASALHETQYTRLFRS